jgi:hypothetical protein
MNALALLLSVGSLSGFSAIHFLIGFIIMVVVLAVVIIAVKWLIGLTGLVIPQPLWLILGLLLFLALLLWLIQWSGLYSF